MADSRIGRAIGALGQVNEGIGFGGRVVAAGLIAVMTAFVLVGVFFRYVLNNSLSWTEEMAIFAMIWVAFLVAPWAYRNGANVSIDFMVAPLPRAVRRVLTIAINLLIIWLMARFFVEALTFVERGWAVRINAFDVPRAWFYLILPASIAAMILVGIELVLRDLFSLAGVRDLDIAPVATMEPE